MKTIFYPIPGKRLLYVLLLGTLALLGSCKPDPEPTGPEKPGAGGTDPLKPTATVTTTIAGTVFSETKQPIPGVRVSVAGLSALTTPEGTFLLQNITVPGNRCVIKAEKTGYFTSVTATVPTKDKLTQTKLIMTGSATTHTINAGTGGKATLGNGSEVQLPANGVVTATGSGYTGQINLSVHYQDPSAPNFPAIVAGGDMLAQRTDGSTSILYSYGILRVKLTGTNGEDLQVAPGKTAGLTVHIPEKQLATAPATIPLWFFDEETGVWKEEGEATRQGNKYVGTVKHFTDWNADDPKDRATIIGKVADCKGKPFLESTVDLGQITTYTKESDGSFSQVVPTGVSIPVSIGAFYGAFPGKLIIIVPPLSPGQVYDLGVIKSEFCPAAVKARLKAKANDPVHSVVFSGAGSALSLYKPGASFTMTVPGNTSLVMKITTSSGYAYIRTVQTSGESSELDLGEIDLTSPPVIVHGIATCGNAMLNGAAARYEWTGGSATASSDRLGKFNASVPAGQQVTLTVTHAQGNRTITFQSAATGGGEQAVGVINVCAPTSTASENSFVISGDVYANALKTLVYSSRLSETHYDENMLSPNTTTVDVRDASDSLRIVLRFTGKTTGTINQATKPQAHIQRKLGNGKYINYYANEMYSGSQVSITVTKYDPVGGLIEGTFSGTFKGEGQSGRDVTVTVRDGKFSAIRGVDLKM